MLLEVTNKYTLSFFRETGRIAPPRIAEHDKCLSPRKKSLKISKQMLTSFLEVDKKMRNKVLTLTIMISSVPSI